MRLKLLNLACVCFLVSLFVVLCLSTRPVEVAAVDPKQFFMPIDMTNHKVINLATPTADGDAVPKSYATNASNLASGTVGTARLGSGTASSSTYLRGDQTWAAVSGGDPTVNTLTDGATVTLAWAHNSINMVTLGGNRALAISGTPAVGHSCRLFVTQDATGSRTLTWPTSGVDIQWPGNDEPILTTTAGRTDMFELTCTDATGGALVFRITGWNFNIY